jgi:predicted TPR repeat methyltransferase
MMSLQSPFRARASSPATLIADCYASAHRAFERGDERTAARLFGVLAVLAPRDERPWLGLALCQERSGRLRAAASLYELGATLAPSSTRCHLGLARALRELGRATAAEHAFDTAERTCVDVEMLAAVCAARQAS